MGYSLNMRILFRTGLWLALASTTALSLADGFSIKRIPKVGSAIKFSMDATFQANGASGTLKATLLEKTTGLDKDGNFTVQQSQLDASATYDSESIDVSARTPITMTYKPSGQVSLIAGDLTDANAYRMENLGALIDPGKTVKVGDIWISEVKEDKTLGTHGVHSDLKVLAEEKIGDFNTIKIHGFAKEDFGDNPSTDDFTVWIDKEDGSIVQLESKWTNAPFPGQTAPIPATIKLVRITT
jgi:hypothetical protein